MPTAVFFVLIPPPPSSTLFPYTTLFRSNCAPSGYWMHTDTKSRWNSASEFKLPVRQSRTENGQKRKFRGKITEKIRSEEHTSELQSHVNLVCRLLLEKKNNNLQNQSR